MRDPITNRYRTQYEDTGMSHGDTVIYNYPTGGIRSTIPRDHSQRTYKGQPYYRSNLTWDVENSGYWTARRNNWVVMNDYKNEKRTCNQNVFTPTFLRKTYDAYGTLVGDYRSVYNDWPSEAVPGFTGLLSVDTDIDYVIDKAVTALHARISSAPMQALVSLGELRQTIGLCRSLLSRTRDMLVFGKKVATSKHFRRQSRDTIIRTLDRGPVNNANAFINRSSRQWLEYRYGIRQLYYDYSAAAKALRAMHAKPRQRYTAVETQSLTNSDEIPIAVWSGMLTHTLHRQASRYLHVTAGALVECRKPELGFIQAFGLDEVFQAAWDLTRFSFIVDWFLNVGQKIAALSPKGDVDVVGSWVKVVDTITHSYYSTYTPVANTATEAWEISGWDPNQHLRFVTTTRLKNPTINPIPNWDIRLSVGKVADLLAIVKTLPILR